MQKIDCIYIINLEKRKVRLKRTLAILADEYLDIPDCYFKRSKYSSLHLFIVYLKDKFVPSRDKLMEYLMNKGIETNIHYIPNSLHSFYRKNKNVIFKKEKLKNSIDYYKKCLTLPLHPNIKKKDIILITNLIKKFFHDKSL